MEGLFKELRGWMDKQDGKAHKEEDKVVVNELHSKKENAKRIFQLLDDNKDGTIDLYEFQRSLHKLGEVWTINEVTNAVKVISSNPNGINFADFYTWLNNPETDNTTRLHFLKLKLLSDGYLTRVAENANNYADVKNTKSSEPVSEIDLTVTFGDFTSSKSSIKVNAYNDKQKFQELIQAAGATENDAVAFITLDILPNADLTKVQSLVAQANLGLAFAKKKIPYEKALASIVDGPNHTKQLVVYVVMSGKLVDKASEILKSILPDLNFSAGFDFDQSPSNPTEPLNVQFSAVGKIPLALLKSSKAVKKIPQIGRPLSEILEAPPFQTVLPLLEFGGVDLKIGSISEFLKSLINIDSKKEKDIELEWAPTITSWASIKEFIGSGVVKALGKEAKMAEKALPSYTNVEQTISGLSKISVAMQNTVVELALSNFSILSLLPSKKSLGLEPLSTEEVVVDDMKLLAFKLAEKDDDDGDDEKKFKIPEGPGVVLANNYLDHTFGDSDLLVLEYAKPGNFTLNHIILKGSRISPNPVRHAFFWAFNEPPPTDVYSEPYSSLDVIKKDEDDHLIVEWPLPGSPAGAPFAHVEVDKTTFTGETHLDAPVTGRYLVALFADFWECKDSRSKATVQYLGLIGPAEKPKFTGFAARFGL
eukprot:TRINITY_DN3160_c0_g1_i1.p1 TRINITY_DN3160_c0_g1~~TRINITY_DN3160_c0_g1_i1.p1  ORF type:complete len:649 (-),score=160.36 TRINITY_DN3160_c0_g1_i1:43-1989(-)